MQKKIKKIFGSFHKTYQRLMIASILAYLGKLSIDLKFLRPSLILYYRFLQKGKTLYLRQSVLQNLTMYLSESIRVKLSHLYSGVFTMIRCYAKSLIKILAIICL